MRILIVEEALQARAGHWPSYIGSISSGMRDTGNKVDVLMHRKADPLLIETLKGTPWLSRNCWLDVASQGAFGGIRHNFDFRRELRAWLRSHAPYDWVCALTMRLQHLLAFALLSRSRAIPRSTRFLLLFVQGFGVYTGPGKPAAFPTNASIRLARFCFRMLAPAIHSGRIILAAETKGMQEELRRFTALPVALFPHPVPTAPVHEARATKPGTKEEGKTITITCPGFARYEKGSDLLQNAILELLGVPHVDRFHFIMQWPEPFLLPDGTLLGPDPKLLNNARVEFLNHSLDAAAYEALLARSDVVILPYRRASYHHRVSRVAIEAASRGIPLVYTSGTWTAEIAELAGCGVVIEDESTKSIVAAIQKALEGHEKLQSIARSGAARVVSYHSVASFCQRLVR